MIKKYNQFIKESLLDKIEGPNEEDFWNEMKEYSPNSIIYYSMDYDYFNGVEIGFEKLLNSEKNISQYEIDQYLNYSIEQNCSLDIVEFILQHGGNPLNKNYIDTPLELAHFNKNDEMEELIKKYINKNDKKI